MLPMCVTKTTSKFNHYYYFEEHFVNDQSIIASVSHHKAVSAVRITVVTDKFSISFPSHLTKAC